ncbi:MAG: transposase [Oscillospiraceae bacterium]|nr:transposase [Oscillospiraceae bacterium]
MEKINAEKAMQELTMMLIYLSRFTQGDRFTEVKGFYAWKGYNFDILNKLSDFDYIRQGDRPSRSKSVYITDSGIEQAKELLNKYGIEDWKQEQKHE